MHSHHADFAASPFRGDFNPRCFHVNANVEEVLARLHFVTEQRRRLGLLLGPAGGGKSQILRTFAAQARQADRQIASVSALGVSPAEFLALLGQELGLGRADATSSLLLWRVLDDHLRSNRYQRLSTLILVDDADEAEPALIPYFARLVQSDPSVAARLTVILAARADRLDKLSYRLLEMAELRIDLQPWSEADTAAYLTHTLTAAGRPADHITAPAIAKLHTLASGIPRRVKQLADLSLLAAAGQELPLVDLETIESVYQELGVVAETAPS